MTRDKRNMSTKTIFNEITQSFISNIRDKKIIEDEEILNEISLLFNDEGAPTVEQLKNVLFSEELS